MPINTDVTLENYVQLATRTEAPISDDVYSRISDQTLIAALIYYFQVVATSAKCLDQIKKNLFYGKPLPEGFYRPSAKALTVTPGTMERLQTQKAVRLLHAILGITTEAGEMIADDKAGFLNFLLGTAPLDLINLPEESGDLDWYQAILTDTAGATLQGRLQTNIDKLRKRYPQKFTANNAINRDLGAEREILEQTTHQLSLPFVEPALDSVQAGA